MQPPNPHSPSLSIRRLGQLGFFGWVKGLSDRTRLIMVAGLPAFGLFLFTIAALLLKPPQQVERRDPASERDTILAVAPTTLAQISPSMGSIEKAQRLLQVMPVYESALADKSQLVQSELILHESQRLLRAAEEEAGAGEPEDIDQYGFSMPRCREVMDTKRCILLRYVGDGVKLMEQGEKSHDVYSYVQGYVQAQAAAIALFPVQPIDGGQVPVNSWLNYREGLASTIPYLPSSAAVGLGLGAERQPLSPAENLIRQNPLPGEDGE